MKQKVIEKILDQIDIEKIKNLTKEMIRIEGHRLIPENESKVAEYIAAWLEKADLNVEVRDVTPGRPNIICVIKGSGKGYNLMFNGHMDTVPIYGWDTDIEPFSGVEKEGKIYGRGSSDMKGGIAAAMVAMSAIHQSGIKLKGDVIFTGVIGEEGGGSIGTKNIVSNGPIPDMAIVCEPTDLNVSIAHRGSSSFVLTTKGKAAHSATPERGINAILMMADALQTLRKELSPKLKQRRHRYMGPPTLTPAVIQGGTRADVVPDFCEVRINYRYPPNEQPEKVKEEIEVILKKLHNKNPEFNAEINLPGKGPGMEIPRDHMIVNTLMKSIRHATGKTPKVVGSFFWTDASILVNQGNIPTALCGPGQEELAHSPNEYVEIDQLYQAAKAYALTIAEICQKTK